MVGSILEGLAAGKRATLASTITLVESEHPGKKRIAQHVIEQILQSSKNKQTSSYRIGGNRLCIKLSFY